ncbi:26S proteasome complex subunit DSS1 isoform X1 [Mycetomoellerius zeteki]|uniref:26S proteasome complex subunit DSS1 isoform X1 n=1 Tax=Mycetomoellerius zeteki TaxID=64791 RepID=UPI00084E75E7|nr:PREDICTED: 26S proteasome complex subunit DSS1 isoform X1 [Trachymyrmex zeteki]
MTDNKNDKTKVDLGLLEEDDEFEEFPAEGNFLTYWTAKDEDSDDISVWEDNWDDDDVEDDFNQQLRAQLEKQKATNDAPKKN